MKNRVLVVAPHADDETLGCAGTIFRHKLKKDETHFLLVSELEENSKNILLKKKYSSQIKDIIKFYNFKTSHRLNLVATKLDTYPKSFLIEKISNVLKKVKPNIIYIPFAGDAHSDHNDVFQATSSCIKWFRYPYIKEVLVYETLSETNFSPSTTSLNFKPNVYKNITKYLNKKLKAVDIYKTEFKKHPFPRNKKVVESLALLRGSESGFKYSEAFILLKNIQN